MRRSSSTSEPGEPPAGGLFGPLFGGAEAAPAVGDRALVAQMVRVEVELAAACADVGLAAPEAAEAVRTAAASLRVDLAAVATGSVSTGNPVVALLGQLREAMPTSARDALHVGATSQDVLDTAFVLAVRDGARLVLDRLDAAADRAADLATEHRDTLCVAHTLGQQALPTTFGRVVAGWLSQLDWAAARLAHVANVLPAVQLGGAVGTRAAYGADGPRVAAALARRLGLADPALPWHTDRQRDLDVATAFAGAVVATGKIAADVLLMASDEVGELRVGAGGSSAMPHKRNPVDAVLVSSAALRVPGLMATLLTAAVHEQERATGAWHAQWPTWQELVAVSVGAASATGRLLGAVVVDTERMQATLSATGGRLMAESLAARLTPALGRSDAAATAGDVARESARTSRSFDAVARENAAVTGALDPGALDTALDPRAWLGTAGEMVDAAVAAHRTRKTAEERRP